MTKKILLILGICVALGIGACIWLVAAFIMDMEKGEEHQRQIREEQRSGKWDFGEQPALFAVAHGIVTNDQDAIRAAAKALPNLQAPGRYGTTLLAFAVRQSWQRPESVESVKTLLSLGADPNYTNESQWSYALAAAVHGPAGLLRSMLEAGGNPNAHDEFDRPIVMMNWDLGYYKTDERARLDLLLDRGCDVNSVMAKDSWNCGAGYTLLLCRTSMGLRDPLAYADALHLLERGADPQRVAGDGMTFGKMLTDHRAHFGKLKPTPPEFAALWDWAEKHGIVQPAQ